MGRVERVEGMYAFDCLNRDLWDLDIHFSTEYTLHLDAYAANHGLR